MSTETRPERTRQVSTLSDDQKTREYSLLALLICFREDTALFSHEVRINVLHRCWGNFVSRLEKRGVRADWGNPREDNGRWIRLDETIRSLLKSETVKMGKPIGRHSILLNLEDGNERVFRLASKKILKAVRQDFQAMVKEYFLS